MNTYIAHWYWWEDHKASHQILKVVANTEDEAALKLVKAIIDDEGEYQEMLDNYDMDTAQIGYTCLENKGIEANIVLLENLETVE